MSGAIVLVGDPSPPRKFILHTAAGREIECTQDLEIDESELAKLPVFSKKYGPALDVRSPSTGWYNCHGLTFASRRAWVFGEGDTLTHVLGDDNYELVDKDRVLPGDVILYFEENGGTPIHSGIVVEVPQLQPRIPRVCSKWGPSAEFLHWANQCPYGYNVRFFRVKR